MEVNYLPYCSASLSPGKYPLVPIASEASYVKIVA